MSEDMRIPLDVVDKLLDHDLAPADATFLRELRLRPYSAGCVPGTAEEAARFIRLRNDCSVLNGHAAEAEPAAAGVEPDAEPPGDPDWRERLIRNKGAPRALLANAITALRQAPEWAGMLSFDAFHQRT